MNWEGEIRSRDRTQQAVFLVLRYYILNLGSHMAADMVSDVEGYVDVLFGKSTRDWVDVVEEQLEISTATRDAIVFIQRQSKFEEMDPCGVSDQLLVRFFGRYFDPPLQLD